MGLIRRPGQVRPIPSDRRPTKREAKGLVRDWQQQGMTRGQIVRSSLNPGRVWPR